MPKNNFFGIPDTRNTRWFWKQIGYGSGIAKNYRVWSGIGYPSVTAHLVHCCTLSLCWDWVQGGNPLYAAVKCLSVSRGQIWQIFFIFFAKSTWHIHFLTSLFFWACTKFFSLLKLTFLFGYHHFSKIEGPFPKLRVRAVRGSWALLLLLIIPALIQCFD